MTSLTGAGALHTDFGGFERRRLASKAGAAAALAALTHHWLWGGVGGLGLALTLAVVGAAAIALNARQRADAARALAFLAMAVAPLVEASTPLSICVALSLAVLSAASAAGRFPGSPDGALATIARAAPAAACRLPQDLARVARASRRVRASQGADGGSRAGRLAAWLAPLALTGVFIELFGAANPVIEDWLDAAARRAADGDSPFRAALIAALLFPIWAWLRPRNHAAGRSALIGVAMAAGGSAAGVVAPDRLAAPSLLLFNCVFAAQTALDLWLLWGDGALPAGTTYAEYAHRGAYPLLAAALLAAGFVLVAFRPGSAAERNTAARALVYLWLAQIAVLVCAAAQRLDLYVGAYGLTMFRAAAFVWMALVAAGLALIAVRIATGRSGRWLIGANALVLGAALYAFCFVDGPARVADYNVDAALRENGPPLDVVYLASLGPQAIPAADRVAGPALSAGQLAGWRRQAERRHRAKTANWRLWTRRDLRLLAYLDAAALAPHHQAARRAANPAQTNPVSTEEAKKTETAR